MQRLSSNSTLFWKLFVPIAYTTFFGAFILLFFVLDSGELPLLESTAFKIGYVIFYLIMVTLIWFTIADLKRVEVDDQAIYVTNYMKTFKYQKSDIESVKVHVLWLFRIVSIRFKGKTSFGSKIRFIQSEIGNESMLAV